MLADPAKWIRLLCGNPRAVIAAAWRRAAETDPDAALEEWFDPDDAAVSPLEVQGLRGAVIALPPERCPAAVDYVAAALPDRSTHKEREPLYLVSERYISETGELTSRLGRWRGDGTFEDLGPGVPWGQLVFEHAIQRVVRSMRSG